MKFWKVLLLSGLLIGFLNSIASAQCTVTGVSGSGFLFADQCAPVTTVIYYEFTFSSMPPKPSYLVMYFWRDGNTESYSATVQSRIVAGFTVYYVRAELSHTFPATGLCEYEVMMQLVDNGFACLDSRQFQIVGNWHQDDILAANGIIEMDPLQEDVCEGSPLIDFQFQDISNFACNIQDNPLAQKPNHTPRHEQFVYGTNPIAGQGIPNLYIKVGTAQTVVYLTNASGNPVANSWTVDPITGANVTAYSTQSGYFEGPIVEIPLNGATGIYSLNNTYPISFDGVGTVVNDQFQVTVRNWNVCNPWNGSQTNPNAGAANIGTSRILIIDAPPAPTAPNRIICLGQSQTLTVTSPPVGTISWYADAALTTFLGSGITYTPAKSSGVHDFWVVDKSNTGFTLSEPCNKSHSYG